MNEKAFLKSSIMILILFITAALPSYSQIKIVSSTFSELLVSPESMNRPIISVGLYVNSILLESELRNSETSEILIRSESNPISVRQGINAIQPMHNSFKVVEYGNSEISNYLRIQKRLPSGRFEYCVRVRTSDGEYFEDELCKEYFVIVNEFLHLIYPADEDTITNLLPVLNWSTSAIHEMKLEVKQYRIILTDKEGERDAETALNINPGIFFKDNLNNLSIPYPASATALQKGHSYAWRVECLVNGQVVEETESWTFTIKGDEEEENRKYVLLKQDLGGESYKVLNGKIYFALIERYSGETEFPKFQIRSDGGELMDKPAEYDLDAPELNNLNEGKQTDSEMGLYNKTIQGPNKYLLDITKYGLKPGLYTMEVWNFKNELYKLKFRISE